MTASQNHGFIFEDIVIKSITGFSKQEYQSLIPLGYMSSLDIYKNIHSHANYSIKTMRNHGSVGCGDIISFYNHCLNNEFKMVIGAWEQVTQDTKVYETIYEFNFEPSKFKNIWGDINFSELEKFVAYVKSIPHGKKAQLENQPIWKEKRNQILAQSTGHIIKIDAKIDSKRQRRVQCSISLSDLTNIGLDYTLYRQTYNGIVLPYEQESSPRNRQNSGSILHESSFR